MNKLITKESILKSLKRRTQSSTTDLMSSMKKKYPKGYNLYDSILMSRDFEEAYNGIFMDLVSGEEVKEKEVDEFFSWLNDLTKKL